MKGWRKSFRCAILESLTAMKYLLGIIFLGVAFFYISGMEDSKAKVDPSVEFGLNQVDAEIQENRERITELNERIKALNAQAGRVSIQIGKVSSRSASSGTLNREYQNIVHALDAARADLKLEVETRSALERQKARLMRSN